MFKLITYLGYTKKVVGYLQAVGDWLSQIVEPTEKFFDRIERMHRNGVDE